MIGSIVYVLGVTGMTGYVAQTGLSGIPRAYPIVSIFVSIILHPKRINSCGFISLLSIL